MVTKGRIAGGGWRGRAGVLRTSTCGPLGDRSNADLLEWQESIRFVLANGPGLQQEVLVVAVGVNVSSGVLQCTKRMTNGLEFACYRINVDVLFGSLDTDWTLD